MDHQFTCPDNYLFSQETQSCEHFMFPLTFRTLTGFILTFIIAGFSCLWGVTGGTSQVVVLMVLYNYAPKQAYIVVFTCLFGTSLGSVLSQMRKKINDQPIIQFKYAFIAIPTLFIGSIVGVLINRVFPTIIICTFIMFITLRSILSIWNRFRAAYDIQTEENKRLSCDLSKKYIEGTFDPFLCSKNRYIFKNLASLFAIFIGVSLIKGTQKFESIVSIQPCSAKYWFLELSLFLSMLYFSYHNLGVLKQWQHQPRLLVNDSLTQPGKQQTENVKNMNYIARNSWMAGVYNGLGLGGGVFLIPMYKSLGCNPIQAAATCSFTILSGSLLNVIQGILLGVIGFGDFMVLFAISLTGSYVCSSLVSIYLRKINRVSLVEAIFVGFLTLAFINLPITLIIKFVRSGYDFNFLFGFGSLC